MKQANGSDSTSEEPVRKLAAEILSKVETRKAYADHLLDHTFRTVFLTAPDRALLNELTNGTLRWRGRLDAQLGGFLRRPLHDSEPFIRNLLRLTLYQLSFLDRIPDYAAVNDAVELAKAHGGEKAAGFVNGVLRNFLRGHKELSKPDAKTGAISALAGYWSHPDWLIKRWQDYIGVEEIEALLKANNEAAPLVLRANHLKNTRASLLTLLQSESVDASPTPWSPQGIVVQSKIPVNQLPGFRDGRFQIQGEASQLVAYLLDPQPGERILDACAAPGGKTTHIAEMMTDQGEVLATDISIQGLKRLEDNATRLGLNSIRVFHADANGAIPDAPTEPFDRILVDAPCSGFGTLRSHPEIKWNRVEQDIQRLSRLQRRILARAAGYLKTGGILVYSTCTLTRDENEAAVEEFLASRNEFVLDDAASYLPGQSRNMVRGRYFMALPHRHNTDGFFAARLRKVS